MIRSSWALDTCAPDNLADWHAGNPARGQCGVTALVLHDLLGGDLMVGEVHVDGVRVDHHWWNRFGAGIEVDLTREQFAPHEIVSAGRIVERPPGPPGYCHDQYEQLRGRVLAALPATS